MFATFVFDRLYKMYSNFFNSKPDSIIDPLTCIIRLAVLEFKPENTKISIANNRIRYCDPTILQGPLRWGNGDNREDIHNIYNPIIRALQWYDVEKDDIVLIFTHECKNRAIIGDLICKYLTLYKQAKAIIVDGNIRDFQRIKKEGYNIWYNDINPIGCFNVKTKAFPSICRSYSLIFLVIKSFINSSLSF